MSIHGHWPQLHHITINLRQDILYHVVYWNAPSVKLTKLLENRFVLPLEHLKFVASWKLKSRCYSTLIDWCYRMHPIRMEQTAWLLFLSTGNPCRGWWSLWKLHFSKIIWWLALGFSLDLRLNAMRRSINLSVCLVFDFWVKIGLALECSKIMLFTAGSKHKICRPFLKWPLMPSFWIFVMESMAFRSEFIKVYISHLLTSHRISF